MQIVIDISEDDYIKVQDGRASVNMMRKAIRTGTLLPKGHGRLIDAELLDLENLFREDDNGFSLIHTKSEFQTIIEADEDE